MLNGELVPRSCGSPGTAIRTVAGAAATVGATCAPQRRVAAHDALVIGAALVHQFPVDDRLHVSIPLAC